MTSAPRLPCVKNLKLVDKVASTIMTMALCKRQQDWGRPAASSGPASCASEQTDAGGGGGRASGHSRPGGDGGGGAFASMASLQGGSVPGSTSISSGCLESSGASGLPWASDRGVTLRESGDGQGPVSHPTTARSSRPGSPDSSASTHSDRTRPPAATQPDGWRADGSTAIGSPRAAMAHSNFSTGGSFSVPSLREPASPFGSGAGAGDGREQLVETLLSADALPPPTQARQQPSWLHRGTDERRSSQPPAAPDHLVDASSDSTRAGGGSTQRSVLGSLSIASAGATQQPPQLPAKPRPSASAALSNGLSAWLSAPLSPPSPRAAAGAAEGQ